MPRSTSAATHGVLPPNRLRRPPWGDALIALIAFAALSAAVLDDYGMVWDEVKQRDLGLAAIAYALGDAGALPAPEDSDRYYGVAFEVPLILIERLLGLTDSHAIYLSRHLLTHLSFLAGGFFCWLLTFRLFRDRRLALFALLLFLLQPRLYAHSFFNTKDIPFLAMFMVALYLLQRAFRRDTAAAFALCGLGVGVLVNLRVMGLLLAAAVPALRALDLLQAQGPAQRRRVLATAGAFLLAAAAALYLVTPYLWRNPLELIDTVVTFSQHPAHLPTLFQGKLVRWPDIPPHYVPTWMAVTTPPAALLLSLAGIVAVIHRSLTRPRAALRNTPVTRFGVLLAACPALSIAAVIAVDANLYKGWQHMYFLAAPLVLLAVYGLRRLLAAARRRPRLRRGIYALAAAGVAAAAVEMALVHPHQMRYFNFLVDRRTPEYLSTRYEMGYWEPHRDGLKYLLRRHPQANVHVVLPNRLKRLSRDPADPAAADPEPQAGRLRFSVLTNNWRLLPAAERRRIVFTNRVDDPAERHYVLGNYSRANHRRSFPFSSVVYARRIYHNTILTVAALDPSQLDAATVAAFRAAYRSARAREPVARSDFDVYLDGNTLTYVKDDCTLEDLDAERFFLHLFPANAADLPAFQREQGFDNLDFYLWEGGVRLDGTCAAVVVLPDYEFTHVRTGQFVRVGGQQLWSVEFAAGPTAQRYRQARAAIRSGAWGAPAARAAFDLYFDDGALAYHKEPCLEEDLRERFFLHLIPADAQDLSAQDRPHGFENRGFYFREHGARLGAACVALVPLPEYAIVGLRTGQFISGQGQLWSAEITLPAARESRKAGG